MAGRREAVQTAARPADGPGAAAGKWFSDLEVGDEAVPG